jgi:serine/threonine protein kinase
MLCPQCGYNNELIDGGCARCGYGRTHPLQFSSLTPHNLPIISKPTFSRGDIVNKGRYRLNEQIDLPEIQRNLARAWQASSIRASQQSVIIRELLLTDSPQHNGEEYIRSAALQLNYLAKNERGIPQIIDVFREQGRHFIVLERTEGNSLAVLIQKAGPLPEDVIAKYGLQMCQLLSVLSAAQQPIIHGSISPSTIIVSPDGTYVSLIHFPIIPAIALSLKTSNVLSTDYLAPEQVRGTVGPSSDLYSLAATLHYAITGYNPSGRTSFFYPSARRLNPAVTVQMETILAKQLRLSIVQRYPDAATMQHDLEAVIATRSNENKHSGITQEALEPQQMGPLKMHEGSNNLLDMGILAVITVLMLIGLLFFLLH